MKILELLESRFGDAEKFVIEIYELMREHSVRPHLVSLRLKKDNKNEDGPMLMIDVEGYITNINFKEDQVFKNKITKILTTMYGKSSTFKVAKPLQGSVGWRVGPYFVVPTTESGGDKNVGNLIIHSIEEMKNIYKGGHWA